MLPNEEVERDSVANDSNSQFYLDGPHLTKSLNRQCIRHLQNQHYNAHPVRKAKGYYSLEDTFLFIFELFVKVLFKFLHLLKQEEDTDDQNCANCEQLDTKYDVVRLNRNHVSL